MEKDKRRHLTLLASFGSICFSRVRCDGNSVAYNFVRAFTADVTLKKMSFYHIKNLLYYFTTLFYNISFIRYFIIQFYILK